MNTIPMLMDCARLLALPSKDCQASPGHVEPLPEMIRLVDTNEFDEAIALALQKGTLQKGEVQHPMRRTAQGLPQLVVGHEMWDAIASALLSAR